MSRHLIEGLVFGAMVGPFTAYRNRAGLNAVGGDRQLYRRAVRAAKGEPLPQDPDVRDAAEYVFSHRVGAISRQCWAWVVFGVLLVASATMAIIVSPWWWLALSSSRPSSGWTGCNYAVRDIDWRP